MLQRLKIKSLEFPSNLIQGPLAGYSCSPMRVQTWRYSQPAYCSTEMASANHLVHVKKQPRRYTDRDPAEGPLCFQLCGSTPAVVARATRIVNQLPVDIIELNCGCPVNKIRGKGSGSKLLSQPERFRQIIAAMRANTNALLSVKIRVAGKYNDQDDLMIASIAQQEGADMLVVHGRHWRERYDVTCDYQSIAQLVDFLKIPVIGNGDVSDLNTLKQMLATGCAGVMIARASMGQPWLFKQLQTEYEGGVYHPPTAEEVGSVFIDHIQRLAEVDHPYRAVLQARAMGKYYARSLLANRTQFLKELMQCQELVQFNHVVDRHFRSL